MVKWNDETIKEFITNNARGYQYESIDLFGGQAGLIDTQIRDKIKNDFCKDNNITLIRLPYYEVNNFKIILNTYFK